MSLRDPDTLTHQIKVVTRQDISTKSYKIKYNVSHLVIKLFCEGLIYILLHFDEINLRRKSNNSWHKSLLLCTKIGAANVIKQNAIKNYRQNRLIWPITGKRQSAVPVYPNVLNKISNTTFCPHLCPHIKR